MVNKVAGDIVRKGTDILEKFNPWRIEVMHWVTIFWCNYIYQEWYVVTF